MRSLFCLLEVKKIYIGARSATLAPMTSLRERRFVSIRPSTPTISVNKNNIILIMIGNNNNVKHNETDVHFVIIMWQ